MCASCARSAVHSWVSRCQCVRVFTYGDFIRRTWNHSTQLSVSSHRDHTGFAGYSVSLGAYRPTTIRPNQSMLRVFQKWFFGIDPIECQCIVCACVLWCQYTIRRKRQPPNYPRYSHLGRTFSCRSTFVCVPCVSCRIATAFSNTTNSCLGTVQKEAGSDSIRLNVLLILKPQFRINSCVCGWACALAARFVCRVIFI